MKLTDYLHKRVVVSAKHHPKVKVVATVTGVNRRMRRLTVMSKGDPKAWTVYPNEVEIV